MELKREDIIMVRLTWQEKEAIRKMADENNRSMSGQIRHLVQEEIKRDIERGNPHS